MKFISFGIGYLLAVLVVDVYSTDIYDFNGPKTTLNSPYNFDYYKASHSLLILEITLKNIPPSVTAVTAIKFTYMDSWNPNTKPIYSTFTLNVDKKTREGKIMILPSLEQDQIWVDVQLRNGGEVCNETRIIEGRADTTSNTGAYYWDTTQRKAVPNQYNNWERDGSGACFAPKACKIILDLKNTCKAQPKSTYGDNVECHIKESQYICTFVRAAKNFLDYELSQTYGDNSIVGPVWDIKQQTTKLSIKLELELFDNNTSYHLYKLEPSRSRTNKAIWSDTLRSAQDISKASNVTILKYTDTTDVQFSCAQYQHRSTIIYVGFINTTDNKITTRHTTIMKRKKFMMADNGTILCCLIYEYQKDNNNHDLTITRFVKNKTLLIYQSQAESNKHVKPCLDKWWLYVLPTLLGTTILLLTLYIVKKQRWCTNSQPAEETVELDNYATTNQVLYANLDFVHNESRAEIQTEESPYANIVGVLHSL